MATSRISAPPAQDPARTRRPLRLRIAGGPLAPARARSWLQSAAGWLPEELEAKLQLLTSELVNNSVVHGGAGEEDVIEIEVRATRDGVRASVSDPGSGFAPQERTLGLDEPGGWGLELVERMSERWGVERAEGSSVWFELAGARA
jgi:anti-sigma regulatory factor (Ser/Thr protein kinase)